MKFSFVVITFNHEKYIIEHLESIRYQILEYGNDIQFQLILADDGSTDGTVDRARRWLARNGDLFRSRIILDGERNQGTCYNYTKSWERIDGDYCKITAGDDVYSCESIFESLRVLEDHELVSGIPLLLIDGSIRFPRSLIFHMIATDAIYSRRDYLERLKRIEVSNPPNLFIAKKAFMDKRIYDFIRLFSVTEDFPLHIKMAEVFKPLKSALVKKVFVYYRRTNSSTYLIRNDAYNRDKISLYRYLIERETNPLGEMILRNRLACFRREGRPYIKALNLSYYLYLISLISRSPAILRSYSGVRVEVKKHQEHMDLIKSRADQFMSDTLE